MKLLKLLLLTLLISGCANTDEVDDSDVTDEIASGQNQASDSDEDSEGEDVAPTAAAPKQLGKGPFETSGAGANMLYNIASANLKRSEATLSYTVKCTYIIKPLSVKGCMVKTGFLPADAKARVGKLLLEAKNLTRKQVSANEVSITTNYTCVKGKTSSDTTCSLDKG